MEAYLHLNSLNKVIKFSKSKDIKKGRLIYCPPFTLIDAFSKKFKNCQIGIGGQNCHEGDDYGPYTGSINSHMLKKYWCTICNHWSFRK